MKANYSRRAGAAPAIIHVLLLIALLAGAITYYFSSDTFVPPADNTIKKFASYDELEKYVKASSSSGGYGMYVQSESMMLKSAPAPQTSDMAGEAARGSPDYSKTNIQVEGVDEADIVKTDGKYIYAVSGTKVSIVDAYPAESAKKVYDIDFKGSVRDIFVQGDKLVVFGQKYEQDIQPAEVKADALASEKMMARPDIYPRYSPKMSAVIYDISDLSNPAVFGDISIGGNYYSSRMIGNYVYVIASAPVYYASEKIEVPQIISKTAVSTVYKPEVYYFDGVPGNVFTTIAAINLNSPKEISSKIILTNYAQNLYVSENNIYLTYTKWLNEADYIEKMVGIIRPIVPSDIRQKIDAVMDLDVSRMTKWQAVQEILNKYSSALTSEERNIIEEKARKAMDEFQREMAKEREKTVVQRIEISGGNIEYKANGEVPGNTLNQFSMDEYAGYLRIATTTSGNGGVSVGTMVAVQERTMQTATKSVAAQVETESSPPAGITAEEQMKIEQTRQIQPVPPAPQRITSQNHIYVLDSGLKTVGSVEDLAPGERIYSVRFLGERAYMVTFRQIDPLYVIDLSLPQSPRVLGYLKVPGVSDYLHPYDRNHVIGVGRDATVEGRMKGMKISLFDVSDVGNPKVISDYIIGESGTTSEALNDHKAFLFSKEKNLLVLPVQVSEGGVWNAFQGAYVFNIDLANGITLKGKVTHSETSSDAGKGYYYDYAAQIRRSLYIDNILYTVSQRMIKMNNLAGGLELVKTVELPIEEAPYPIPY